MADTAQALEGFSAAYTARDAALNSGCSIIEHSGRLALASKALASPMRRVVMELRGRGIDDEGGWDTDVTQSLPVQLQSAHGKAARATDPDRADNDRLLDILAVAATGLRDLYLNWNPAKVTTLSGGEGLGTLVRGLRRELQRRGRRGPKDSPTISKQWRQMK